ncbi:MAG: serine--tRNA ligase [Candidatus Gygaella obscura]|nr:serine--tRNA ligase [Candidatus Gygaella obscura]
MLDIKFIAENKELVEKSLKDRKLEIDLDHILELNEKRKKVLVELDELRRKQNLANDGITKLLKEKKDAKETIASMKAISHAKDKLEDDSKNIINVLNKLLLTIPNLVDLSVPVGSAQVNKIIRTEDNIRKFDFKPATHIELSEQLDVIDFARAAKLTGSNFVLFKGWGARLERALINFMLDFHQKNHGYKEVLVPFLVNADSMTGTGQLPKMEDDMYALKEDGLYLIPTAEVPITNIHRNEILDEETLPIYYMGYSACFRREAGSYGKDTRGLSRVHQFDKVELVKFVKPADSYKELESLVNNAEAILKALDLSYRVVLLSTQDLSFASSKTYDLEIYASGIDKWLEVSSCSNFESFQARRANIRFRGKETKKLQYVHTLNGSGVALPRLVIAIMENYQNSDGSITIPEVLRKYLDGQTKIS